MPAFPQSGPELDTFIRFLMQSQPEAFPDYDSTKNKLLSQALYAASIRLSGYTFAGLFCNGEWQGFNGEFIAGGICPESVVPSPPPVTVQQVSPTTTVTVPPPPQTIVVQPSVPLPPSGARTVTAGQTTSTLPSTAPTPIVSIPRTRTEAMPVMRVLPMSEVLPKDGGIQIIDMFDATTGMSPEGVPPGPARTFDSSGEPVGSGYYVPAPVVRERETVSTKEIGGWPILLGLGLLVLVLSLKK